MQGPRSRENHTGSTRPSVARRAHAYGRPVGCPIVIVLDGEDFCDPATDEQDMTLALVGESAAGGGIMPRIAVALARLIGKHTPS